MTDTATIHVHICANCGDHAHEEAEHDVFGPEESGQCGKKGRLVPPKSHVVSYFVEAIALERCGKCGLLVCESCLDNGWCCERASENQQMVLFE